MSLVPGMGFFGGLVFGPRFFWVLLEALGIFLGLDFWLHSIIPVTWNPEYPPGDVTKSLLPANFTRQKKTLSPAQIALEGKDKE